MNSLSSQPTIAAIATPLGEGALGIVRMSGPQAITIAQKVFVASSGRPLSGQKTQTLRRGWLEQGDQKIDEVMLAIYRSPASFTGEDVVEIIGHGGFAIMRKALNALLSNGAEPAEPGEFTKRAFLNGKMDLAQAEAVIDLIAAKSDSALNAGLARLQGGLSKWVRNLRGEILGFYAPLEAAIDFPEEEIESLGTKEIQSKLQAAIQRLSDLQESLQGSRFARNGVKVTILGRPNAGKSSLFNALLVDNRALVSTVAGTTRDLLEETVMHKGFPMTLVDTAGLRDSPGRIETQGISLALKKAKEADVLLYLVDSSKSFHGKDEDFIGHNLRGINCLVVFTKSDLPPKLSKAQQKRLADGIGWASVSAIAGQGLKELKDGIVKLVNESAEKIQASDSTTSANARQSDLLTKSQQALQHALRSSEQEQSYEVIAMDISRALQFLGEITGETASDELLHAIFSRFCIGK